MITVSPFAPAISVLTTGKGIWINALIENAGTCVEAISVWLKCSMPYQYTYMNLHLVTDLKRFIMLCLWVVLCVCVCRPWMVF